MSDPKYVRGGEKLVKRLATIRANITMPALTLEIGNLLLARTLNRFDQGVDPNGNPWPKLADSTLARKKRDGQTQPLVRTGDLRAAIKLIRGGIGTIFTNTGAGVRIGIEDPEIAQYAKLHQQGLNGLPVRKFLGVGALDVKAADNLMRRKAKQLEEIV